VGSQPTEGSGVPDTGRLADLHLSEDTLAAIRRLRFVKRGDALPQVDSSISKAVEQLHTLLEFFLDQGLTTPVTWLQIITFVQKFSLLGLVDRSESYLKWKTAHIACLCLGQSEFPDRPQWVHDSDRPDTILGGSAGVLSRRICHLGKSLQTGQMDTVAFDFGWNISQLKKGMPEVSDAAVEAAVAKTTQALTKDKSRGVRPFVWAPIVDVFPWKEDVSATDTRFDIDVLVAQAIRSVDETHPRGWYSEQDVVAASISGHCLTKRADGGALGAIVKSRSRDQDRQLALDRIKEEIPPNDELEAQVAEAEDIAAGEFFTACTRLECRVAEAEYTRFCHRCGWNPSDSGVVKVKDNPTVQFALVDSIRHDEQNPASQLNIVRPVGLKEPFKTRTITGGPEGKYYRCKYIQKAVHSHLRKKRYASLIGEVIGADRLNQQLWKLSDGDFYVSGDYSAATDNLDPRLSEAIARRIGENAGWHKDWIELFVESLIHHRIWVGEKIEGKSREQLLEHSLEQKWGQLMGSPTSFPVLCIANLALTRHSLELRYGRQIKLKDSGILINGDDVGFVTDKVGYGLWKQVTSAGGLEPSIGKNFCSERFIVLNSAFFDVSTAADGERLLTHRPYVNYGLLRCRTDNGTAIHQKEAALCPSTDPRTPGLGALAHDLVKGHPEHLQVKLLKRFIASWKPTLDQFLPRGMSYFLPTHLGGLGLPIVGAFRSAGGRERYSYIQRRFAAFLALDPEKAALLTSMATLGHSESVTVWSKVAPILRDVLEEVGYTWTQEPGRSESGALTGPLVASAYASLCEDDIARQEEDLPAETQNLSIRYRHWRRAYELLFSEVAKTTYEPLSEQEIQDTLPWRKVYDDYVVVNPLPKVDLRLSPNQLLIRGEARLTFVHDETFDLAP
jgi:hypothetical protein